MDGKEIHGLVDLGMGTVKNEIYNNPEIYDLESRRVFGRTWLFVAHESMIPKPGDYVTNYMGEDGVIVWRESEETVRVFLNKCRHRGNRVCLFDRGNSSSFSCSYHGWTYGAGGKLIGVPLYDEIYGSAMNKDDFSLLEVPRVEMYSGLVFACWDKNVISLKEYLGDLCWYLDNLVLPTPVGGIEVVPGKQKYLIPVNWKLLAENFAGDHYHFQATHASFLRVTRELGDASGMFQTRFSERGHEVCIGYGSGVPHGMGQLRLDPISCLAEDVVTAKKLGDEAVDWVNERYRRVQAAFHNLKEKPYGINRVHFFPNFSFINFGSPLDSRGLILWHPRGPNLTEVWTWCAVEKDAPKPIKENAIRNLMLRQAAAGLVAPDDSENFERLTDNTRTPFAKESDFSFNMGKGSEEKTRYIPKSSLPGLIGPAITEVNQRQFYRYWMQLMSKDG